MNYFIYILKCSDNKFYTGITNNLKRRILEHSEGNSLYTKSRLPINLVYYEVVQSRKEARKREILIKDMNQEKKKNLIKTCDKLTSII